MAQDTIQLDNSGFKEYMITLVTVKQDLVDSEKIQLARVIVALISLLGIREQVYKMLR